MFQGVFGDNNQYFLKCPGLIAYFTEMVPKVDWSDNEIRPTLFVLLKRLDRLFQRLNATLESRFDAIYVTSTFSLSIRIGVFVLKVN